MKILAIYGNVYVDGDLLCMADARVIPKDAYRVDITFSEKYKMLTPELVETGTRIFWKKPGTDTTGDITTPNLEQYSMLYNAIADAINAGDNVTFTLGGIK